MMICLHMNRCMYIYIYMMYATHTHTHTGIYIYIHATHTHTLTCTKNCLLHVVFDPMLATQSPNLKFLRQHRFLAGFGHIFAEFHVFTPNFSSVK